MHVHVYDALTSIPESIAARCAYPAVPDFFLSLDWFRCLFDTAIGESMSPRVYCAVHDNGQPNVILFCATKRGERTLYSMSNFYTMEFAPVALGDGANLERGLGAIVKHIKNERPTWARLDFRLLRKGNPDSTTLIEQLDRKGFSVEAYPTSENWFLRPGGSDFDHYYARLPSRLKNTIKRKEKALRSAHEVDIVIHTEPGAALDEAVKQYVSVYNNSWKRSEPFVAFMPSLIAVAAAHGTLRLGMLRIDGQPAAAQVWITTPTKAVIYKLAYDETYAHFSPGSILSRELFRFALDRDQPAEIDYGVGSEPYKTDWMDACRPIKGVEALNPDTVTGRALAITRTMKNGARRLLGR